MACPKECTSDKDQRHSTCYEELSECVGPNHRTFFTATLLCTQRTVHSGDWANAPRVLGNNKYTQASCEGMVGKSVCWSKNAPIHVSDGFGPQDQIRQQYVDQRLEEIWNRMFPKSNYPPLALPKSRGTDLDTQTADILAATHRALNSTNPDMAKDCWLCMTMDTPMPLAIPSNSTPQALTDPANSSCSPSYPFAVQPLTYPAPSCLQGIHQDNATSIDVGFVTFASCRMLFNYSAPLCPTRGQVFVCGANMAYTFLPTNWTGLCVLASLLPDMEIIVGDQPMPMPTFDSIAGHHKRAVGLIPILVVLGVSRALATGSAGLGVAMHSYAKLSKQLIDDVQALSSTIQDIQDHVDSLAEVVLQNRRGLDLLTAEQGGICLALQERCCFYSNKSVIVRDKLRELQDQLLKQRQQLADDPFSLWGGMFPYLVPLLGPLFSLVLLLMVITPRLDLRDESLPSLLIENSHTKKTI
ncbi:syncytin-1-like [Octodon degus]|uniref:Syncytin-1-like n=1 Tax=Octodon degus TaxID=10160 RepID=A0A6P6F3T7_OCTDE|nr:syncytin-1-like [Octodon degus]